MLLSQSPSGLGNQTNPVNTLSTSLPTTNLLATNPLNAGPSMLGASQTVTHTFTVINTNDSGAGSLRSAIAAANADTSGAADVINFNLGTGAHLITLGSTLDITAKNLTINGTGANNLSISGNNQVRDFLVEAGANVTISGLTVTQGITGGIVNNGTLTLNNDTLSNNTNSIGGGILNNGALMVSNSTFSNNFATGAGAGIFNYGGTLTVKDSTFSNNSAVFGGAIDNHGTVNASGLVFFGNTSTRATGTITDNNNVFGTINFTSLTVDRLTDTPLGKGSLSSGLTTLRDALAAIGSGGTITFSPNLAGTITLTQGELDINKNVTIQGLGANQLSISGNNKVEDFNIASGANVTISGLTITEGAAANGGGILNNGTLTLNNDSFTNNAALGFGGAVNNNGVLTINSSTFSHNTAAGGGAIGSGNRLTVNGSTFTNNSATSAGGAIDSSGALAVNNSTFTNNTAPNGGGIYTIGTGTISGSTFTSNTAQNGGAINNAGILTLTNDNLTGNKALNVQGVGGGIWNNGMLTLNGDTITGNSAVFEGGGVFNTASHTVNVHNTIIQNNTAVAGPDVFGAFVSQGGNTIGIMDNLASGFVNGTHGDKVQKTQVAKMESYTFTYNYTPQFWANITPQDYIGSGYAAVGTYKAGQTISIKNNEGQVMGTYTINSVNDNLLFNSQQFNQVNIIEYDYNLYGNPITTRVTNGTGLLSGMGTQGLGSEQGTLIGVDPLSSVATFSNQKEAIVPPILF